MSKLEQNTTSLDEVLAMVNALPDAGGGGGGGASAETCTVEITLSGGITGTSCSATCFENGVYVDTLLSGNFTSKTLTNVVCGSSITVCTYYSLNTGVVIINTANGCVYDGCGGRYKDCGFFTAPTTAGATGTIKIKYD
jgi:hypothetical protein